MATNQSPAQASSQPHGTPPAPPGARASASRASLLVFIALLTVLPLALPNQYFYDVAILIGLNAIVCIGLNLLIGYAGQISLGHAAFFGMGAYGSGILASNHGWPPLVSIVVVTAIVGVLAFIVGRPVLRLRGHYLAMATLGLGAIASTILTNEDRITGGPDGMPVVPLTVFGASLGGERGWYMLVALLLLVAVLISRRLIDSPIGRALRALHGSEAAAQLAGIDAARYKTMAFVLSAVFAAFAGALAAHYSGFITPVRAGFLHSVELVTMVVFGGLASTWGAVVGAAVLTLLPHLLTVFKDFEMIVLGAVMMLTMILMPRGLVPTLADLFARRKA